ncbi:glycine-rich domain-containing protein [Hydrogenophaga sp. MI9]|uniref:glycine-rich domain-containing protein n=1 Tax=Hydrogenophaga sp. MI9 TaxID=3453719 RepID=UPI003EE8FBE2
MNAFLVVGGAALTAALAYYGRRYVALRREAFIRHAEFPRGLFERLQQRHPGLSTKDCQLVAHGLRQFFLAHLKSGRRFVSMPSQVVDDLWHEFILYTKNYELFCRQAFGRFLHHTPAVVLGRAQQGNAGLRRCWWFACKEENINPRNATRLPLLFALDSKLGIAGGFRYVADCQSVRRTDDPASNSVVFAPYCGGDFSDPSFDGSLDGFGDTGGSAHSSPDSSSSEASGDSSGGSDGCGGGGCGGGD